MTRILIVEDELLVAMDLEATLIDNGWQVVGPAQNVARALALLNAETPDAACIDMNLGRDNSTPVAEELVRRKIPFVIVSGYNERNLSHHALKNVPLISKPVVAAELIAAITGILHR